MSSLFSGVNVRIALNIASSPGHSHHPMAKCVTLENWEWPVDEATKLNGVSPVLLSLLFCSTDGESLQRP